MKQKILFVMKESVAWLFCIFFAYPFLYAITTSLKSQQNFFENPYSLFARYSLVNYVETVQNGFLFFFVNSIVVLVLSVALVVALSSLVSYGLERIDFGCNKWLSVLLVSGMMLPVHASLIPIFVLENKWHIYDTLFGAAIPQVAFAIPISIFIVSQFVSTIPVSLFEAAKIDGASHPQIFQKVAFPLLQPAIVTIIIYNGVRIWNNFSFPLIFIQSRSKYTIPLGLQDFYGEYSVNVPGILSAIIIATIPLVVVYFLLQDSIEAGLTGGAVKE